MSDPIDNHAPPPPDVQREVEMWRQVWDNVKLDVPNLREDNKPLAVAAAYALARLDAERYRWLRQFTITFSDVPCGDDVARMRDNAIDAARAAEAKGESPEDEQQRNAAWDRQREQIAAGLSKAKEGGR